VKTQRTGERQDLRKAAAHLAKNSSCINKERQKMQT